MTNGDKIRTMTDEELADLLCNAFDRLCDWCPISLFCDGINDQCINVWRRWLIKEDKDDER